MTTSHFIDIPRRFFHYHCIGTAGDPLFFCHGNSMSAGTYPPFLERLAAENYQVFVPGKRPGALFRQRHV